MSDVWQNWGDSTQLNRTVTKLRRWKQYYGKTKHHNARSGTKWKPVTWQHCSLLNGIYLKHPDLQYASCDFKHFTNPKTHHICDKCISIWENSTTHKFIYNLWQSFVKQDAGTICNMRVSCVRKSLLWNRTPVCKIQWKPQTKDSQGSWVLAYGKLQVTIVKLLQWKKAIVHMSQSTTVCLLSFRGQLWGVLQLKN